MGKTKPPPTLAARVRYVRELVPGLSMRTLSLIAGLSPSTVGEIERGNKTTLGSDLAIGFTSACGVSLDWLLRATGDEPDWDAARTKLAAALAAHPRGKSGPKAKAVSL